MNNVKAVTDEIGPQNSFVDYALVPITLLMGWVSLMFTMIFIYRGPLNLVNPGLAEPTKLAFNTFLSLVFFAQHSGMIRRSFRSWSAHFIDEKYQGALYTITSSLCLFAVVMLWRQSDYTLVYVQGPLRWLFRGVFYLSLAGIVWGMWSLGKFDAFGLDSIRKPVNGAASNSGRLTVRGPYRWVRHPLYTFCILMIWSNPDITADRLVFNILWTAWIVVGAFLEERDLVEVFGEEYQTYQRQAPMLIPNNFRPIRWKAT